MTLKDFAQVACMVAVPLVCAEVYIMWRQYQNRIAKEFTPPGADDTAVEKKPRRRKDSRPGSQGSKGRRRRRESEISVEYRDSSTDRHESKTDSNSSSLEDKEAAIEKSQACGDLARYILLSRDSIDICNYDLNSHFLVESILRRHHLGVRVRVITDHEGANILSSQMEEFYKQGIQVRPHRGSGLMHHKFIVIDNKIVATGSFNFTAQATLENYENIVVSDNMDIVGRYIQNFAKMWKRFDYAPAAAKQARM